MQVTSLWRQPITFGAPEVKLPRSSPSRTPSRGLTPTQPLPMRPHLRSTEKSEPWAGGGASRGRGREERAAGRQVRGASGEEAERSKRWGGHLGGRGGEDWVGGQVGRGREGAGRGRVRGGLGGRGGVGEGPQGWGHGPTPVASPLLGSFWHLCVSLPNAAHDPVRCS